MASSAAATGLEVWNPGTPRPALLCDICACALASGLSPGAYVGIWLAGQLGLPEIFTINVEGEAFPIVWGIVGSAILSLILGLFTRRTVG